MTSIPSSIARAGCAALVLLAGFCGTAFAQTASNTQIDNSATLQYKIGNVQQTDICSSPGGNNTNTCSQTSFKVDTKVNLNVVTTDTAPISTTPGGSSTMTFTVSNTGNANQDFNLTAVNTLTNQTVTLNGTTFTDSFNSVTPCTFRDAADNPITKLSNVPFTGVNSSVTVKVVCSIDALKGGSGGTPYASSGTLDYSVIALRATATPVGSTTAMVEVARGDPNTPGVVLADGAGTDDANTTTPARDASFSARSAQKAVPAALLVAKSVITQCDPFNGVLNQKNIPGAIVRYTITISNAAGAPASALLTAVNDTLSANLTGDINFVKGDSAAACFPANPGAGTATNANGDGLQVKWTGTTARTSFSNATTGTKYLAGAVTTTAVALTTANWATLLPAENGYAAGELKGNESVQLIFNAFIK